MIIKTVITALAFTIALQAGVCRDLVNSSKHWAQEEKDKYDILAEMYRVQLSKYKAGTLDLKSGNSVHYYVEVSKERRYNFVDKMAERRRTYLEYCGGFNPREQEYEREVIYWRNKKLDLLKEVVLNPYFVENWQTMTWGPRPHFIGIKDFKPKTGYDRD